MQALFDFINENPVGQFATIDGDKPVMRPFHFVGVKDGRFYFMTANTKEVYKQLVDKGVAAFAVMAKGMHWARINGKVAFVEDPDFVKEIFDGSPLVQQTYKTPDNPVLQLFYLYDGDASLYQGLAQEPLHFKL